MPNDLRLRLPEVVVPGRRLGRHIQHDPRSLRYLVRESAPQTTTWKRVTPILDQGNLGSCHDAETEILTRRGWLPFPDLSLEHELATVDPASGELIYEKPTRVIDLPYSGDIHVVSNTRHDFRVTPDHMMLVRKWDERARTLSGTYSFVPMEKVGWYAGLMANVRYAGTPHDGTYRIPGLPDYKRARQRDDLIVPMRTWLGFLGIYLAEGTMLRPTVKSPYKVQIAASKEREKTYVRRVLTDLGLHFLEAKDRFTFDNGRIYRHLEDLGLKGVYAAEKFVPEFVFDLPAEDIQALLEGHREGDGSLQAATWTHHTSSPRLADDLQRLIFLAGGQTGVSRRGPRTSVMRDGRTVQGRHGEIGVRHLTGKRACIDRAQDVRIEHYEGHVYCAEVPTHHTLVTRRNGKILISGNCTGNAMTGVLGSDVYFDTVPKTVKLDEAFAVKLYSLATQLDGYSGQYPPTDTGSDGLSAAKAVQQDQLCNGYTHATSLAAMYTLIKAGPFAVGVSWHAGMDTPNAEGVVHATGAVRGGHEFQILNYNASHGLWEAVNSWGDGWAKGGHFFIPDEDMAKLLAEQGDATQLTPLTAPAPVPTPVPAGHSVTFTDAQFQALSDWAGGRLYSGTAAAKRAWLGAMK